MIKILDKCSIHLHQPFPHILQVSASSKYGNTITYTTSDSSRFGVNNLGEVTLAKALSRDSPDGFAPQQVTIIANDGLNPPTYAVLNLNLTDINDHRPLFDTCCTKGYVDENSGILNKITAVITFSHTVLYD